MIENVMELSLAESDKGEQKLTEAKVVKIRSSAISSYRLAKQLGLAKSTVMSARSGATWAHVRAS